jgi:hypothetical protein
MRGYESDLAQFEHAGAVVLGVRPTRSRRRPLGEDARLNLAIS